MELRAERRCRARRSTRTSRRTRRCRRRRRSSDGRQAKRVHVVEGRVAEALGQRDGRCSAPGSSRCAAAARRAVEVTSPGQQPEPGGAVVLGRALEQQLHAEADARARGTPAAARSRDQLVEPERAQAAHRLREGADAGDDDARGRRDAASWSPVIDRLGADVRERLLDRAAVAHPVVDDRDHRSALGGRDARLVGSIATATRSARANALKQRLDHVVRVRARPGASRCSVSRAARGDGAEELLGGLVLEARDVARRQAQPGERRSTAGRRRPARTRRAPRPSG